MSEKAGMPQKRPKNPNGLFKPENLMHLEPGDNRRYIRAARAGVNMPPIDISDPKQVERRINEYFDYCEQNDIKPGFVMLGNWLGVSRSTLNQWKKGDYRSSTHTDIIQKAVSQLESLWEMYMLEGKVNIVAGIFIGKQYYGAVDKQEIAIVASGGDAAPLSPEEIAKRLPDPDADYDVSE